MPLDNIYKEHKEHIRHPNISWCEMDWGVRGCKMKDHDWVG